MAVHDYKQQGMVVHDYKAWAYTTKEWSYTTEVWSYTTSRNGRTRLGCGNVLLEITPTDIDGDTAVMHSPMLHSCLVHQRLRVGGHAGGYFSVPPRTVWICCFLGSPVWDLGPELVGCRLFAPWDLNPLALDCLASLAIAALSGQLGRGPSSMIDSYIFHPTTSTRSCTLQDIIRAQQKSLPVRSIECSRCLREVDLLYTYILGVLTNNGMPPGNIFDILVRSVLTAHVRRGSDNAFLTRLYGKYFAEEHIFFSRLNNHFIRILY